MLTQHTAIVPFNSRISLGHIAYRIAGLVAISFLITGTALGEEWLSAAPVLKGAEWWTSDAVPAGLVRRHEDKTCSPTAVGQLPRLHD